jgi:DNA-binding MarR family transcriptional regulator
MIISPTEKEIVKFIRRFTTHNKRKYGVSSITQSQIAEHFGYDRAAISYFKMRLYRQGLITSQEGKGSCFWQLV